MNIRRFVAPDLRQAMRAVRTEQGPDAVILSTSRLDEGVEIIAARDYDAELFREVAAEREVAPPPSQAAAGAEAGEGGLADMREQLDAMRELLETQLSTLAWNDTVRRRPHRARLLRNLARVGIDAGLARELTGELPDLGEPRQMLATALQAFGKRIPVAEQALLEHGGVAALFGPTGVGKTTTIAKLAARYALRAGTDSLALVCADAYRIGAREQLATFGRILGVPVHLAQNPETLQGLMSELRGKRLVLIDTAGWSHRDPRVAGQLEALRGAGADVYLTLQATAQREVLDRTCRAFGGDGLAGVVLTKIDEAVRLGDPLSALIAHGLPLAYLTDGQRVPEDLHRAAGKTSWLLGKAVELARTSPAPDEDYVAEHYSEVAHG